MIIGQSDWHNLEGLKRSTTPPIPNLKNNWNTLFLQFLFYHNSLQNYKMEFNFHASWQLMRRCRLCSEQNPQPHLSHLSAFFLFLFSLIQTWHTEDIFRQSPSSSPRMRCMASLIGRCMFWFADRSISEGFIKLYPKMRKNFHLNINFSFWIFYFSLFWALATKSLIRFLKFRLYSIIAFDAPMSTIP